MATLSTARKTDGPDLAGRLGRGFTPLVALQACHLAELTGTLSATSRGGWVRIALRDGEVAAADSSQGRGLDAIVAFGAWSQGEFAFVGGVPHRGTPVSGPFNRLLLDVCRRIDEAAAAARGPSGPS